MKYRNWEATEYVADDEMMQAKAQNAKFAFSKSEDA